MKPAQLAKLRETKFAPIDLDQVKLTGVFSGYASLFNQIDLGNDIVLPGAFKASLKHRKPGDVRMLFQHDPNEPIGRWTRIEEDATGLRVEGQLTTTTARGAEVLELMRAGALDGLSIGFKTVRARNDPQTGARRIIAADLWEISVVTFPMLEAARIENVKAANFNFAARPTVRQFEKWLTQDAGLTRNDARTVIAKGFNALEGTRDAASTTPIHKSNSLADRIRAAAFKIMPRN